MDHHQKRSQMALAGSSSRKSEARVKPKDLTKSKLDLTKLSNKVHVPWYRRYVQYLSEHEECNTQPVSEIIEEGYIEPVKKDNEVKRNNRVRRSTSKEVEQKEQELAMLKKQAIAQRTMKPNITTPIANYLNWVRRKNRMRNALKKDSARQGIWLKRITPGMRKEIQNLAKAERRNLAKRRFKKVINAVLVFNTFLKNIKNAHASSDITLGEISELADQIGQHHKGRVFDAFKYKRSSRREENAKIPFDVKLVLTRPWYNRTLTEVNRVVDLLNSLFIFVKYPKSVAFQLSRVAWYSQVVQQRPIFRQTDIATCFCFLISGAAKVTTTSSDIFGRTVQNVHRYIRAGEMFGEDDFGRLNPRRNVTIRTLSAVELLTVNYMDYQQSLLSNFDRSFRVPRHIQDSKNISVIRMIPLFDILTVALDYFHCMYFPVDAIICESMQKSSFVYVILQGECFAARISNSGLSDKPGEKKVLSEAEDTLGKMKRMSAQGFDFSRESRSTIVRGEIFHSKLMVKKDSFNENVMRACEHATTKSKQEIMKEVHPRIVLNHFMGESEIKTHEDALALDVAKKIKAYELANEEYSSLLKESEAKTKTLKKILARFEIEKDQNHEVGFSNGRQPFDNEQIKLEGNFRLGEKKKENLFSKYLKINDEALFTVSIEPEDKSELVPILKRESDANYKESHDKNGRVVNENETPQDSNISIVDEPKPSRVSFVGADGKSLVTREESSSKLPLVNGGSVHGGSKGKHSLVTIKESSSKLCLVNGDEEYDDDKQDKLPQAQARIRGSLDTSTESSDTSEFSATGENDGKSQFKRFNKGQIRFSCNEVNQRNQDSRKTKASCFRLVAGNAKASVMSPRGGTQASVSGAHGGKKSVGRRQFPTFADKPNPFIGKTRPTGTHAYRTFRKVKIFRPNFLIGNEYIDYNDGTFRAEVKDYALVSGGAEVVLISKWFLLDQLYCHW